MMVRSGSGIFIGHTNSMPQLHSRVPELQCRYHADPAEKHNSFIVVRIWYLKHNLVARYLGGQ